VKLYFSRNMLSHDLILCVSLFVTHRRFFDHEAGRNSVEFLREAQDGETILLALKFDSKSIAKDVLNR